MPEIRTYKMKYLQGTVGNTEYWTDEDWKRHEEHVKQLKVSGEYLKETEVEISLVHNPLFDTPDVPELTEVKLILLDFSNATQENNTSSNQDTQGTGSCSCKPV